MVKMAATAETTRTIYNCREERWGGVVKEGGGGREKKKKRKMRRKKFNIEKAKNSIKRKKASPGEEPESGNTTLDRGR